MSSNDIAERDTQRIDSSLASNVGRPTSSLRSTDGEALIQSDTIRTIRNSFATNLARKNMDLRSVQLLLDRNNLNNKRWWPAKNVLNTVYVCTHILYIHILRNEGAIVRPFNPTDPVCKDICLV